MPQRSPQSQSQRNIPRDRLSLRRTAVLDAADRNTEPESSQFMRFNPNLVQIPVQSAPALQRTWAVRYFGLAAFLGVALYLSGSMLGRS